MTASPNSLKAFEVGEKRANSKTNEELLAIRLDEFAEIKTNADLGKLCALRLPSLDHLGEVGL